MVTGLEATPKGASIAAKCVLVIVSAFLAMCSISKAGSGMVWRVGSVDATINVRISILPSVDFEKAFNERPFFIEMAKREVFWPDSKMAEAVDLLSVGPRA
jgi:hypothetical protein